jgi:hypothetical protein
MQGVMRGTTDFSLSILFVGYRLKSATSLGIQMTAARH